MATEGYKYSEGYQGRCLLFQWWTNSVNSSTNVRNIGYRVTAVGGTSSYYYHHYNTVDINGTRVYDGESSEQIWQDTVLAEGSMDINQSSYSTLSVSMHGGIYVTSDNIDTEDSWTLDTIPRYATISASVASRSFNSVQINWSTDANVDTFQYRLNGGSWVDAETGINKRSGSFTIPNLSPNTSYAIGFDAKRKDSQQWSTHGGTDTSLNTSTKDIGKISSISNFNHGDSESITITNPSGASLTLEMKIGDTQILSQSVSTGSNTINFTDNQLDAIYKLYGSGNTLTATFNLYTGNYKDTKEVTITLTGNQKTAHTSQGRAKVYVGVNGSVKRAIVWVGNNGRKRCI